ncbi:unnamed protein product [Lepeophtheirus salmonis]|uniref:(salmon louse) hypothetical protein n=1 Tax=Lepeophtheirus salmonis TaxID=72036 RepID=A0A7R8CLS8_LEPSM|nr:unnamed protein product [Lepeophtheirus salmonis]CAF2858541.1 unnamed protein product [Lepeophtheirus salmonis]
MKLKNVLHVVFGIYLETRWNKLQENHQVPSLKACLCMVILPILWPLAMDVPLAIPSYIFPHRLYEIGLKKNIAINNYLPYHWDEFCEHERARTSKDWPPQSTLPFQHQEYYPYHF